MNVVLDLVAEILFHFSLNLIFVERIDRSGINPVSAEKLPMTLIKLPERSVRPLSINSEGRSEFEAVGKRIIPCGPNRAVFGARRNAQVIERSEEHTSELQSRFDLVCRLLLEKKKYDRLM